MSWDLHVVWLMFLGLAVVAVVGTVVGVTYAFDRRVG